jgi:hypothetical protein
LVRAANRLKIRRDLEALGEEAKLFLDHLTVKKPVSGEAGSHRNF